MLIEWLTILSTVAIAVHSEIKPETKVFRSTRLGFSFDYPATWRKELSAGCGHDNQGKTREDLLRERRLVMSFRAERQGDAELMQPSIGIWYQGIMDESARHDYADLERKVFKPRVPTTDPFSEATSSIFRTNNGVLGIKTRSPMRNGLPISSVGYVFTDGKRMISLNGSDGGLGLQIMEPLFDEAAKSLQMFETFREPPTNEATKTKTCKVGCARFEYPSDWTWTAPFEDDDMASNWFTIQAPNDGKRETASVGIGLEKMSLEEYAERAKKSFGEHVKLIDITPISNARGTSGVQVRARFHYLGNHQPVTMIWYTLRCSDGRLATLFFQDFNVDDTDWQPIFDRIAETFVVE